MRIYRDVKLADPFLRPNWRHERVVKMLDSVPPERVKRTDDKWIAGYKKFLQQWNKSEDNRDKLLYEDPGLYFAYVMFDRMFTEPELRLMIEARLLSGLTYEDIADECKTIPETIQWYERLFFNVIEFLPNHDWIMKHVLLPSSDRFVQDYSTDDDDEAAFMAKPSNEVVRPHLDMTLKFFAYYGGPLVCDMMISGFRRDKRVTSQEDLPEYFHEQFMSQVTRRSAQSAGQFEINKYNVMELFATHTRIIEIQRSAESAEDRHNEFEKHVIEIVQSYEPEDVLFLYTDGIIEARDAQKEEFGMKRLEYSLKQNGHLSSTLIIQNVINDLYTFCGNEKVDDDYTCLAIKFIK